MHALLKLLLLVFLFLGSAAATLARSADDAHELGSPDGRIRVTVQLSDEQAPSFTILYHDRPLASGELGLQFAGADPLVKGFEIVEVRRESRDETYEIPVGKTSSARDHHNELVVTFQELQSLGRRFDAVFRAYDDGVAFRYAIARQGSLAEFTMTDERTRLRFSGDPTAHIQPLNSYTTPYEKYYQRLPVSNVRPDMLVGLPMLLEPATGDDDDNDDNDAKGPWIAVTEAALTDYAGMYLAGVDGQPGTLASKLSPLPGRKDGAKVLAKTPFASPWRVLMIAEDLGDFIESNIVLNLNEPSAVEDPSWIKPGRTTFPWWNGYVVEGVDFEPGVNTATMKHYIDFCAEHDIEYHSLDGLDIAWYGGPIQPDGPTDVTTAAPSINMPELLRYAEEKGVRLRLWMHWKALQPQLDEAFQKYEEWGIEGVMIDFMDRDDQEMVAWYHEVAKKAAQHHLTVNWHGAYKPTGMERTWPNVLNYEAALNQEYNKWSNVGTPPEHNLNVAFIRMLAGPVDYHHGGMRNVLPDDYQARDKAPPVQGTRGHQLALFVVYQNHLPMLVDYPSAYRGQPGLEFLASVPTSWDETKVLHADFGVGLIVARRQGDAWYLGGITGKDDLRVALPLEFIGEGSFAVEATFDDPANGPTSVVTSERSITANDKLQVQMPRAGGFVAVIRPNEDVR